MGSHLAGVSGWIELMGCVMTEVRENRASCLQYVSRDF